MKNETSDERIAALLDYWFDGDPAACEHPDLLMRRWFAGTPDEDRELGATFGQLAAAAAAGELDRWAETPRGRLALIILLDQLPRSLYRGKADAFASDLQALALCLEGLAGSEDRTLHPLERIFFCMPLQHAESGDVQARSAKVFGQLASSAADEPLAAVLRRTAEYASEHRAIVDRFGRFPHRNNALGRASTAAESDFLSSGGPTYGQ